jgi:hypothetical protein
MTKCNLSPKNHPRLAIPTATPPEPLASLAHAGFAAGCQTVEHLMAVDAAIVTNGKLGCISEVEAGLLATQAMQQNHQRREQSRHQADEAVIMRKIAKAGTILLADPVVVKHLEMLERREVKQHHDEQHLGLRQLAWPLPGLLGRDQPVGFPGLENLAEIVETAIQRRDIDGH